VLGGTDHDLALGVGGDSSGNIYAAGFFSETADFAPTDSPCDADPDPHTSAGGRDAFLVKYLPSGCW